MAIAHGAPVSLGKYWENTGKSSGFVIHFINIDCTFILFKKLKTTHRKLMRS
jgi:hypothetical protein